jgi:hypothetical protein
MVTASRFGAAMLLASIQLLASTPAPRIAAQVEPAPPAVCYEGPYNETGSYPTVPCPTGPFTMKCLLMPTATSPAETVVPCTQPDFTRLTGCEARIEDAGVVRWIIIPCPDDSENPYCLLPGTVLWALCTSFPRAREQCDQWQSFTVPRAFSNRGACVSFVATGRA